VLMCIAKGMLRQRTEERSQERQRMLKVDEQDVLPSHQVIS
jgi:hypothetical protein